MKLLGTVMYKGLYEHRLLFFLSNHLGVEWLGLKCIFNFLKSAKLFSKKLCGNKTEKKTNTLVISREREHLTMTEKICIYFERNTFNIRHFDNRCLEILVFPSLQDFVAKNYVCQL